MLSNLIVIFFTILLGLIFSDPKIIHWSYDKRRKLYIQIIIIILVLQSGLRHIAVGADTYAYLQQFEMVKLIDWYSVFHSFASYYIEGTGKDPGYLIFQKVVQIFIGDYQVFLLLIAVMFFTSLGNFIYKNTSGIWEAVFAFTLYSALFYSFFSITGHRQTIATALVLYCFELIKKRKLLLFLILTLFASTIHRSCLIFLPFYFLFNLKRTEIVYTITLLLFPVFMFYRETISETLIVISGYQNYGIFPGAGTPTFTAMLMLVALFVWWRMKYVLPENEASRPFFNAFILAIIFTPLTWINPSAMRIVQYFSIFLLVLIPHVIESFSNERIKLKPIVYMIAIVGLIVLSIKAGREMEYKFFWQEMELGSNYTQRLIF